MSRARTTLVRLLAVVRAHLHRAVHRGVQWAATRLGYDILWRSYYNGIPRLENLPHGFWERRSSMAGADLMVERALDYLEQELGPYIAEFDPQRTLGAPGAYYVPNRSFDLADGAVAWAMIRRHQPRRVLELGSGFSTLLIRDALKRNGPGSIHVVVDPYPSTPELLRCADLDLKTISAGDLPGSEFDELGENDVLFIDTTHTVKVGGEVNQVFLERLPRLSSGVLVHVHDVFLPYEYPREFVEDLRYYWAEQYLLQAFLAFNSEFETLVPNHFLLTDHASQVRDLFPSGAVAGSSFWFRRK